MERVYVVIALAADYEDLEDRPVAAYRDRALAEEHKARADAHLQEQLARKGAGDDLARSGERLPMEASIYDPGLDDRWTAYWMFEVSLRDALPSPPR
jgi:hypothetical protein